MRDLRCLLGLHDFQDVALGEHWERTRFECARGCGASGYWGVEDVGQALHSCGTCGHPLDRTGTGKANTAEQKTLTASDPSPRCEISARRVPL